MGDHVGEERLNDWIDGRLPDSVGRDVDAHLAVCPACRMEADRLSALVESLHALPRRISVSPRVWEAVERRSLSSAGTEGRSESSPWTRSFRTGVGGLHIRIAASIVIALMGAATALVILPTGERDAGGPPPFATVGIGDGGAADFARSEERLAAATRRLEGLVRTHRDALPADVGVSLDESVRALDRAIVAVRREWRASSDPRLALRIQSAQLQKLALLERAVRISRPGW